MLGMLTGAAPGTRTTPEARGVPGWLLAATVSFTLLILFMAIAETTLWTHFLVDRGEYVSIAGLVFIVGAGIWLYSNRRLKASLPLCIPWMIYPVLTQADQLIDNFTINQMRLVSHVILAILFGAPIVMIALAALRLAPPAGTPPVRRFWTGVIPGLRLIEENHTREGVLLLSLTLVFVEIAVAIAFLGHLMVGTLVLMGLMLIYVESAAGGKSWFRGWYTEKAALVIMLIGAVGSLSIHAGFKNRPGAYEGSPSAYLDPSQKDARYDFERIPPGSPAEIDKLPPDQLRSVLQDYAQVLLHLNHAYYVMDRNYNYTFHNFLFLRHTPVQPGFREASLAEVESARALAQSADGRVLELIALAGERSAAGRFLQEIRDFTAYDLRRASVLEGLSNQFVKTEAGFQHATHIYEGEGKLLDDQLARLLRKHNAALERLAGLSAPLVEASRQIHATYENRIVGF